MFCEDVFFLHQTSSQNIKLKKKFFFVILATFIAFKLHKQFYFLKSLNYVNFVKMLLNISQ